MAVQLRSCLGTPQGDPCDLWCNMHIGLDSSEVDFFLGSAVTHIAPAAAQRIVDPPIPEPGTLTLPGVGLIGLAGLRWQRK